ncbi:hypothetical protein [Streptosporangium jomthongense]|uniref:Uncharacterized protein n=1 Tax=Streptosporangium jomthongense TaxID=1193683 RepID=A0ABV8F8E1_9ACTN
MTTIIPDFGLAAHLDRQTPAPPSAAVTAAREIAAQAARLKTLPIAPEERAAVLGAIGEAAQACARMMNDQVISIDDESTSPCMPDLAYDVSDAAACLGSAGISIERIATGLGHEAADAQDGDQK